MLYFAYGSNMCTGRLRERVPSAQVLCRAKLSQHTFHFHKRSIDGSAKGNALETLNPADVVWGVVFEIDPAEKRRLDVAEGLGHGYLEKNATVADEEGRKHSVLLYVAEPGAIDDNLQPYSWYKRFVVEGARQHGLPVDYIATIEAIPATEDQDRNRDARNRAIGEELSTEK
jgi:hypothetical protein